MNGSSTFKPIHAIGVALGAAMVGIFLWSTLGAAAFNGPTQNPSGGNGAIYSDSSNNVYISGNLNVSGTISGAGGGGSTINAANVSAGEFGDNTGGGTYSFPSWLQVGASSTGGAFDMGLELDDSGNGAGQGLLALETPDGSYLGDDEPGDLVIWSAQGIALGVVGGSGTDLYIASNGYVGVGTTTPQTPLEVNGDASVDDLLSVGGPPNGWSGDQIQLIPNGDGNTGMEFDYTNTSDGYGNFDFNIGGAYLWSFGAAAANYTEDPNISNNFYITNDLDAGTPAGYPLIVSGTSSYVGIQEVNPANTLDVGGSGDFRGALAVGTTTTSTVMLNVNGTTSAAAYCISGANCITAWPSGGGGSVTINGSTSSTFKMYATSPLSIATGTASTTFSCPTCLTTASNYLSTFNGGSGAEAYNLYAGTGLSIVNGTASTTLSVNQAATLSFSALGNTTSTGNVTAASLNLTDDATTASTIQTTGSIGKCASSSVTISGAVTSTGAVFVTPVTYPGSGLYWEGYVSAPNTVVVLECAATTTTVTASKFNAIYIY